MPTETRLMLPVLALLLNAFVWGISWWPMRHLHGAGLHPLWSTAFVFFGAVIAIALWRRGALAQVARTPALWWLMLASGITNAAFNWGVTIGDVVRVVLLFYLMPLWTVVLARLLLGEALTGLAALRTVLALGGGAIVLMPEGAGLPLPRSLADWLGVLGGFTFACNNVLLRKYAHLPGEGRAMAMFVGGVLVSGCLASAMAASGGIGWPPAAVTQWLPLATALCLLLLAGNLALQYGAARLPANVTAVVMLSEIVFATVSSVLFGDQPMSAQIWIGGALIIGASLLSVVPGSRRAQA